MSSKSRVIIGLIILVLLVGTIFWTWNKWTGRYKIGAEAIVGCQNPREISQFFGRPGKNLSSYNLFGQEISISEKIKPFLDNVQKDVNAAQTGYSFDEIQTFNIRPKIWGGGQSLHSWGIALDINPDRNPYQPGNFGPPQKDIPDKIIEIFKKHGFAWGGDWPGERDSMHFEWYGGEITGNIIDGQSGQKITSDVAAFVNGAGAPLAQGDFSWLLEAKTHEILVKARGYEENKFPIEVFCFQTQKMDIALKPLADNLPGSISGKVTLAGGRPPVIPATIYLDGKRVGATNVRGDYLINGVRKGKHKIEAKVMFFPGATVETPEMVPKEDIKNLNISIGK